MTDEFALHEEALGRLERVVARVTPVQFRRPTPCTEWDVAALVGHLSFGNRMFTGAAGGAPPLEHEDPVADYALTAAALRAAWDRPGMLDRVVTLPWGDVPGFVALRMHFVDVFVHGWDLAVATGQGYSLDSELADPAYEEMTVHLDEDSRGEGEPFAAVVPWPADAVIGQRLLAFLGRDPHWSVES